MHIAQYLCMYNNYKGTIQDFLCKLGMKPEMHLVEITIFSLYNFIIRPTKIIMIYVKTVHTIKLRAVDRSTIQFWTLLAKSIKFPFYKQSENHWMCYKLRHSTAWDLMVFFPAFIQIISARQSRNFSRCYYLRQDFNRMSYCEQDFRLSNAHP